MTNGAVWQRNDDWVGTEIEDSFVMVHLTTGRYVTFNATAKTAWAMLETPQTQERIEEQLLERFDVSVVECRRDVGELLKKMVEMELVAEV